PAHVADEFHHLQRIGKRTVARRRDAILAHGHAADLGYLFRNFRRRQHAAMAGLGALADLELNHLDLVFAGNFRKQLRIEAAVTVAAAEIAGAYFPDDVAAGLAVIGADAALAGVMREAALPGAGVERAHGIGAERTKAHGGDIEDRKGIGLGAF